MQHSQALRASCCPPGVARRQQQGTSSNIASSSKAAAAWWRHKRTQTRVHSSAEKQEIKSTALPKFRCPKKITPFTWDKRRITCRRPAEKDLSASLRAEAEAPFRSFRLFIFGAGCIGAGLATLFGLPQLIGTLAHADNAKTLSEVGQDFLINIGSLAVCGYFVRADLQARDKQLARLQREEKLGALQLELANGKVLRMAQLRTFARVVMVAGTRKQVEEAIALAEPYKQQLQERGVLLVGLPIFPTIGGEEEGAAGEAGAAWRPSAEDLRWRATPLRLDGWAAWFREQAALANAPLDQGLYVGLRMDGRVRSSGVGCNKWIKYALQLPPTEGFFSGLFDGFDGRV